MEKNIRFISIQELLFFINWIMFEISACAMQKKINNITAIKLKMLCRKIIKRKLNLDEYDFLLCYLHFILLDSEQKSITVNKFGGNRFRKVKEIKIDVGQMVNRHQFIQQLKPSVTLKSFINIYSINTCLSGYPTY